MKDKTPIAKSDKSLYVFISLISFFSLFIALYWLKNPSIRWFGIFYVSTLIFMFLLGVVMLIIMPKNAILQEEENFIIYQGIFKEVVPLSDILKVETAQTLRGEKSKKNGAIVLTVKMENDDERKIQVLVKDKEGVLKRITELIEIVSASRKIETRIMQDVE